MVAYTYRPPGGFPGDITRHDFTATSEIAAPTGYPTLYGVPVVIDASSGGMRMLVGGDTALTDVYGIVVRAFPEQAEVANGLYGAQPFGGGVPPRYQPLTVLRRGGIRVSVVGNPIKGGPVYVWIGAAGGGHTVGGFEAAAAGANTIQIGGGANLKTTFNSPVDAQSTAELYFNI